MPPKQVPYSTLSTKDSLEMLHSREKGLSTQEVTKRREYYGFNELPEVAKETFFFIFLRQFYNPFIIILLVSGIIVILLDEPLDAAVIFAVIFFNAIIGAFQEGKAQNTFLALKKLIRGSAHVLRDEKEENLPDRELVPGDIIILREGEKVPADARILDAHSLQVDESTLTGESLPKQKNAEQLFDTSLVASDQTNMLFKGTTVIAGTARAVATNIGVKTFIGSLAQKTLDIHSEFPLQKEIKKLSRFILLFAALLATIMLLSGIMNSTPFSEIFTMMVAVAVSIIPEGLPIVVTIVLVGGMWRMSTKNVLIKKLQAVEVLGGIDILAVDKTGTITRNELLLKKVILGDKTFTISGEGYHPIGKIQSDAQDIHIQNTPALHTIARYTALHSSAQLINEGEENGNWSIIGDPTEGALTVFGHKASLSKDILQDRHLLDEMPFDYTYTYHASLHNDGDANVIVVTGSPEIILKMCTTEYTSNARIEPITASRKKAIENAIGELSSDGSRVICLAFAPTKDDKLKRDKLTQLTFGSIFGIQDGLKANIMQAVNHVKNAHIRVVMITGDHANTAQSIAREAGIYHEGDIVLSGKDIDTLSTQALAKELPKVRVFARVTPQHKLKIIQAYQSLGHVVSMTGDGVNDAPSLSAADVGVGMGKSGTDVAKEAADILLLDDNFENIVHGVSEGKHIMTSIRRVILYLLSTNMGEMLLLIAALLLGLPFPLLAVQILWLNLVTDGFLDIALAMEPKRNNTNAPKESIINRQLLLRILWMAIPMTIGTLFLFLQYYEEDIVKGWTISLTTLAVFQWFNAWNCQSNTKSIFQLSAFSNPYLIGATLLTITLQLLAIYHPVLQNFLKTTSLSINDWMLIIVVASSIIFTEEARKYIARKKEY